MVYVIISCVSMNRFYVAFLICFCYSAIMDTHFAQSVRQGFTTGALPVDKSLGK